MEKKYEIEGHPFGTIKDDKIETGCPSSSHRIEEAFDEKTGTLEVRLISPQQGSVTDCWYHPVTIPIPPGTKKSYINS